MQTLAYASLAFSVLAAFDVVTGKQWLNSYLRHREVGALWRNVACRGRRDYGLEYWRLQIVLGTFLVLRYYSSAYRSVQTCSPSDVRHHLYNNFGHPLLRCHHPHISIASRQQDHLVGAVCKKLSDAFSDTLFKASPNIYSRSTSTPNIFGRSSAIHWILEMSTNTEVVEATAAMVPRTQWPSKLHFRAIYACLRDSLATCLDRPELFVTYGKTMAHLLIQSVEKTRFNH
jgi:hypothetical protein